MKSPLAEFFQSRLLQKTKELGLLPFIWPRGIFYLVGFLLPWFLLMGAIIHRRKASGLCAFTGETTPSPSHDQSALYQSTLHKRETSTQAFRAQIEQSIRAQSSLKAKRAKWWNFILLGSYDLVYADEWLAPLLKTGFFYTLLWFALPLSSRYNVCQIFRVQLVPDFGTQTILFPFIFLAVLFWGAMQIERIRKAQR